MSAYLLTCICLLPQNATHVTISIFFLCLVDSLYPNLSQHSSIYLSIEWLFQRSKHFAFSVNFALKWKFIVHVHAFISISCRQHGTSSSLQRYTCKHPAGRCASNLCNAHRLWLSLIHKKKTFKGFWIITATNPHLQSSLHRSAGTIHTKPHHFSVPFAWMFGVMLANQRLIYGLFG